MRRRSKFNKIMCSILTILLVIELILGFSVTLIKKTIGDRGFIEKELEKTDFYTNMRAELENTFLNYVYQSNLDDDTVKGVVTLDKVKEDIDICLDIAYENSKKEVNTDSLKKELTERIRKKLTEEHKHIITSAEERDIQTLVNVIIENYSDNMKTLKTTAETLAPIIKKINSVKNIHVIINYIAIVVTLLALSLIYIHGCKNKKVVVNKYQGIGLMTAGALLILINIGISIAIHEEEILIFSRSITNVLIDIIKYVKADILIFGTTFFLLGFGLSLTKNIIVKKYLR